MLLKLRCHVLILLGLASAYGYGQSSYPSDTSYVNELLKQGQTVENSQPTVALKRYTSACQLASKIGFTRGYFDAVRLLTYALNNTGQHAQAKRIAQEALRLAQNDTSKRHRGICHFALANTALFEGNAKQAIPHFQRAAHYMRLLGKQKNVAVIYQNLGVIYEQQRMHQQALDYYRRALTIDQNDPRDPRALASDYFNIGNVYLKLKKPALAQRYYQRVNQLIDPRQDVDFAINLYNNLGFLFEDQARYDSALHYRQQGLRLSRQIRNPRHELHLLMSIGQTYNQMKHFSQAKPYLDKAYQLARREKSGLIELRSIYRNYVLLYQGQRHYKAAYEWYDQYDTIDDSLNNGETKELLQQYELKLKQTEASQKLAQKQQRIVQLEAQRQRQNLWLVVAVLTAAVIGFSLLFSYLYYRQRQRTAVNALSAAESQRELAVMQSELQGQQKERLRIAKEMHDDLGASLTAIGLLSEVMKTRMGVATTPEVEKISSISSEMVTSMNEIIWSLNTKNDNLNGLIAYTRAYASEFVENASLTLRTQVEESPHDISIGGANRRNVFLTVKEALNNIVKHAQSTQVTLIIQPDADQLRIEVCDNGRGFTTNGQTSLRNGLTNMRNRMRESGGTCEIVSSPTGTCVKITFPHQPVPTQEIRQM